MVTIHSDDFRIPKAAREAVARHEDVVVMNRERAAFVVVNPEDRAHPGGAPPRGRSLREAAAMLLAAPLPDPGFGADMAAVIASVGSVPEDPWERS